MNTVKIILEQNPFLQKLLEFESDLLLRISAESLLIIFYAGSVSIRLLTKLSLTYQAELLSLEYLIATNARKGLVS